MAWPSFYDDAAFPEELATYGSRLTDAAAVRGILTASGGEYWQVGHLEVLGAWELRCDLMTTAQRAAVRDWFAERLGPVQGFRFRDWSDHDAANQYIGLGDGSEDTFQLALWNHGSGYTGRSKTITKPVRRSEVQTVALVGAASAGTFTLTFGGQTTGALAYNISAANLETALEGLSSIGAGNVTVTGDAGGPWTVTFAGDLAYLDQALMTGDDSGITGAELSIVETTAGCHVAITVAGVAKTEGTHYDVNYNTGVVTFKAGNIPTAGQSIRWTGEFDKPVRFGSVSLEMTQTYPSAFEGSIPLREITAAESLR